MNGRDGKLETATRGLVGKCQSQNLFNIRNKNTGTWKLGGPKCCGNVNS
jgi:hypothetical protein